MEEDWNLQPLSNHDDDDDGDCVNRGSCGRTSRENETELDNPVNFNKI